MPRTRTGPTALLASVGLAALALLAACGSDSGAGGATTTTAGSSTSASATTTPVTSTPATTTTTAAASFPVTVSTPGGEVTVAARPEKIVSLSSTGTEVLFAIGAGPQVVAVDEQSNHPPEAPITKLSGYTPNLEAILAYEPDLVVASFDPGGLVDGLQAAGVPVVLQSAPPDLEGAYDQIEQLGALTGNVGGAAEVVKDMTADIAELAAKVPERATKLRYFHELDDTLYTVTSKTLIGSLYAMAGLENIADAADPDGTGYPQLSSEYLVQQDPDLIFLADTKCCAQSAATVAARPGWANLSAVAQGGVIPLDDDIASRWGPRLVDFLAAIVEATSKAPAATG